MQLAWKELSRSTKFAWFGKALEEVVYELPDGRTDTYYIRRQPDTAAIVALTPQNEVILGRQFRPGKNAVVIELPGGAIKQGQTPLEAAVAELQEEVGYAGKLQFVTESWPDGYCTRKSYVFVATDCVPNGSQQLDANECIEPVLMPLKDFRAHLRSGKLTDVEAGYLGLDFLELL